jgi:DNA processing protein
MGEHPEASDQAPTRSRPTGSPDELRFWLALLRAPGVGDATYRKLLCRFGSLRAFFQSDPTEQRACGVGQKALDYIRRPHWRGVDTDLRWLEDPRNSIITSHDTSYPLLLRQIPDPPPLLFVRGEVAVLSSSQVAMVGSRNPSPNGAETAYELAAALARAGLIVTSGLAIGIDSASHRGALAAAGATIAVAGTGLGRVYPTRNLDLAERITEQGALVSEFPSDTAPLRANFPQRNRIISGLSLGVVVVEASLRSGSLITARLASEQGREVFALPGSIHNPLARGCHALIRQGAKLVEEVTDILEELGPLARAGNELGLTAVATERPEPDGEHRELLRFVDHEPTAVDTIVRRSGLTPEAVSSILLILELQGHVVSTPGGWYARASGA